VFSGVNFLSFGLGLLGYLLSFFDKDKHPKTYKTVLISSAASFLVVFWMQAKESSEVLVAEQTSNGQLTARLDSLQTISDTSSVKLDQVRSENRRLAEKVDSLLASASALRIDQDSLRALLGPFVLVALQKYPSESEVEGLRRLASDIPTLLQGVNQLQQKLLFLQDRTEESVYPATGGFRTRYTFRSQAGLLNEVRIDMVFSAPIDSVRWTIGEGNRMQIVEDVQVSGIENGMGYRLVTSKLYPGHDIAVDVYSRQRLEIRRVLTLP